jgi:hypothetical protein
MRITDALVMFIAKNLMPLSIVDSHYFCAFIEAIDPKYKIPSRKHLQSTLLHEREKKLKNELEQQLQKADSICLTIDLWSNRQMKGFIGITGHFMADWSMKSVMISCKPFKGSHTSQNIAEQYLEIVSSFGINRKVATITTDNASDMVKAFQVTIPNCTCRAK